MKDRLQTLFKRYLENSCSKKELEEFLAYVQLAEYDEQLRQMIRNVYDEVKNTQQMKAHVNEHGNLVFNEPEWLVKPVKKSRPLIKYMVAAMLLIAGALLFINKNDTVKSNIASSLTKKGTDRSESKFLLLEDSTQVWLNASSALEFPDQFDAKTREVFLTGEAFFDVKHADKIPFVIHTGNISTTVLGTAFNIKAYPGQRNIIISVSRGKVRITRKNGWEITLTKGQQVKLNELDETSSEKNIPTESIAGWQQGNISYDDEPLKDIIADMERIYNTNIHISNPSLATMNISTSFKKEIGVEQALQVLCKLTDTELRKNGDDYSIQ